jgi:hypothetical protein
MTNDEIASYRASTRATAWLLVWGLAWLASLAVARFGPGLWWEPEQQAVSWVATGVNLLAGVAWIVAFARFVRSLDDLQRKIMLDALAVALGAGWVGGFAYIAARSAELIAPVDIAVFPALIGVVFAVAFLAGKVRYR